MNTSGCRLIVHADDFGLSEKINTGVLQAHRSGILTSASLMPTGIAFDHAIQICKSTPTLDIGIHLTLVEERPQSAETAIPSLLAGNGHFHDHITTFIRHYAYRKISLDEVRQELDAQINRVLKEGISVSHLDSHQHVHMLPGIRRVVGDLANHYSIPSVRYPKERFAPYMLSKRGNLGRLVQLLTLNTFCHLSDTRGSIRPDHFFGFFFGGNLTTENIWKILEHLPLDGTCELMCHPGNHDAEGQHNHWGYHWQDELDALTNPDVRKYLNENNIQLISYAELAG